MVQQAAVTLSTVSQATIAVLPAIAVKSATETVNNSTDLQDDDDLKFSIGASETWHFRCVLRIESTTVADFKFDFSIPAGATGHMWSVGDAAAFASGVHTAVTMATDTTVAGTTGTTNYLLIEGIIINSTTAGTVQLRWAQNTAEVADTNLLAGSHLIAHRLA